MIAHFHTPKGIFIVDTDTVSEQELTKLDGMNRDKLNDFLARQPKDLIAEIDDLKARIEKLEKK